MQEAPGGPEVKHRGIGADRRAPGTQHCNYRASASLLVQRVLSPTPTSTAYRCHIPPQGIKTETFSTKNIAVLCDIIQVRVLIARPPTKQQCNYKRSAIYPGNISCSERGRTCLHCQWLQEGDSKRKSDPYSNDGSQFFTGFRSYQLPVTFTISSYAYTQRKKGR
jgi:hypothetical protein